MEVTSKRKIKSGKWYRGFVREPEWGTRTIKTGAQVSDTVAFIQKVIRTTTDHTRDLAPRLRGRNLRETCRKVWEYVFDHIEYEKDAPGIEQVRSPARTLHEQKGDCDCMATLIGSILSNLNTPFRLRVTKYRGRSYYQHIYVVVPEKSGGYITIDPVVEWFDYEEPFTAKKDIPMDLQYLNGPGGYNTPADYDDGTQTTPPNIDAEDLFGDAEEMEGLGLFRRKKNRPKKKKKKKGGLVKVLHAVNKFNPATVALRAGILAAAKLGKPGKMWEKLLWALVPDNEARSRGANMVNHAKIKGVFERVKKIFRGAGGKPENLEKALVRGKVNQKLRIVQRHRALAGVPVGEIATNFDENSSLLEILGPEIYNQEIVKPQVQMSGFAPALGAVATGGALAIAMTALGAIAAVVAKIGEVKQAAGNILKKKDMPDPQHTPMQPMTPELIDPSSGLPVRVPDSAFAPASDEATTIETSSGKTASPDSTTTDTTSTDNGEDKDDDKPKKGFFRKENIPLIAVGGVGLTALGIWGATKIFSKKKEEKPVNGLGGTPRKKRKKKKPRGNQGGTSRKRKTSTRSKRKPSPRGKRKITPRGNQPKRKTKRTTKRQPVNLS